MGFGDVSVASYKRSDTHVWAQRGSITAGSVADASSNVIQSDAAFMTCGCVLAGDGTASSPYVIGPWSINNVTGNAVSIDGTNLTFTEGDKTEKVFFELNPDARPRRIEFFQVKNKKKGLKNYHGIYEFDGEQLKLCWGPAGKARPTAFKTKGANERRAVADHPLSPKLFVEDMLLDYTACCT